MNVEEGIRKAWEATVADYNMALDNNYAKLWTEYALRLNFIRRLSENVKLDRILAEVPYPMGMEEYKPDIIADVSANGDVERIVFELKFFGSISEWLKDLEKLKKYALIGWDKGYFIALGSPQRCEEIKKAPLDVELDINPEYKVYVLTSPAKFSPVCNIAFYRDLMKRLFEKKERSIVINESSLWAIAIFEKYGIIMSGAIKQGKLVLYASILDKVPQNKTKELEDYQWFTLNENDEMQSTSTFENYLLIDEIDMPEEEVIYVNKAAEMLREPITRFREKMKLIFES